MAAAAPLLLSQPGRGSAPSRAPRSLAGRPAFSSLRRMATAALRFFNPTPPYEKKGRPSRRGRGAGRGRGRRQAPESQLEPQPELHLEPQLEPPPETVEERPPEGPQGASLEEKAEIPLDPSEEPFAPLVDPEQLCTQQLDVAEAAPAGDAVFSVGLEETSGSEEPEVPESLENDHLAQELYGSF